MNFNQHYVVQIGRNNEGYAERRDKPTLPQFQSFKQSKLGHGGKTQTLQN